jgi:hypothetical protein
MKLETTLEERPGFLHALPLFDLFALVMMLLLLGPMFITRSGVTVEAAVSQFQMQRFRESIVVTLGPGESAPRLHLGRKAVTLDGLEAELKSMKSDDLMAHSLVLLKADVGSSVGMERQVAELILGFGFKLAFVGRAEPSPRVEIPDRAGSDD